MIAKRLVANVLTAGLKKFRGRHEGDTCYIFGDGPSIKWFDLERFADHPGISCGMMPFHRDFSKLDVRYVALVEPWLFAPEKLHPHMIAGLSGMSRKYRALMMSSPDVEFFVSLSNAPWLWGANINYVYRGLPGAKSDADRALNRINIFAGSFYTTLGLAHYMGFKKVYLVGFDAWTIQPARNLRWYEFGSGEVSPPANLASDLLTILKPEMEIFTISNDGASSNVMNINYRDYAGREPVYRENYELTDRAFLETLSACPYYKIFP